MAVAFAFSVYEWPPGADTIEGLETLLIGVLMEDFFHQLAYFMICVHRQGNGGHYAADTCRTYCSYIKVQLESRPNLQKMFGQYNTEDPRQPIWYSQFNAAILRAHGERWVLQHDGTYEDGLRVKAIYNPVSRIPHPNLPSPTNSLSPPSPRRRRPPPPAAARPPAPHAQGLRKILLTRMSKEASRTTDLANAEGNMALLFLYHFAGRANELRSLAFSGASGMYWDPELNAVVLMWRESKTLRRYPIVLVPHAEDYIVCPLFALANYGIHGGFERDRAPDADPMAKSNNMVFGELHKLATVAPKISKMLPDGAGSHSGRHAAVTVMEHCPETVHQQTLDRSGHRHQDHSATYTEATAVATLPGGKALSEWACPKQKVFPPTPPMPVFDKLHMYGRTQRSARKGARAKRAQRRCCSPPRTPP